VRGAYLVFGEAITGLVVQILMAIAEWERKMIGVRTKEGMAQSNKRAGRLPGSRPAGSGKPAAIPENVLAVIRDGRAEEKSPRQIAERLNSYGLASPRGKRWHRESVRRVLARLNS
jgi:DNA invertase Pin-like site-specific DNA recombinase